MRIIHIIPAYKPAWSYGGPTGSVSLLCESLAASNQQVEVYTTRAKGKQELQIKSSNPRFISGVKVRYFKRLTKDPTHFSPSLLLHLYLAIRKKEPIVIHIHSWWNLVSILSAVIALSQKKSVVLSPRGMLSPYTFSSGRKFLKKLIHFFTKALLTGCHMHATTEQEKHEILTLTGAEQLSVIPNLLKSTFRAEHARSDDNIFKILFLSRVDPKKGLEILFEALASLDFTWHMSIAGTGTTDYISLLRGRTEKLNIARSIVWLGEVDQVEKYKLLLSHDILALLSHNENFGNVVLESLSVGTPVLISTEVGLTDYVDEHGLGWISEMCPKSAEKSLRQAYADNQKRQRIAVTAPSLVSKHFSPQLLCKKYIHLYNVVYEQS